LTRRRIATIVAVCLALAFLYAFAPSPDPVVSAVAWLQSLGPTGWLVFALLYLCWTVAALPASWPQMIAGFIFGPVLGFVVAHTLSTLSSTATFLLARTRLRTLVAGHFTSDPRFHAIDGAIGSGGTQLVAMLRMSPLSPFNIVTYALSITQVSTRHFVAGTALGCLPPVLIFTYLGSTVGDLSRLLDGTAASESGWVQALVLATTLVATALVTRFAQQALKRALRPLKGTTG
jgi:uncharacterized membrane protein YdjX (TVP38/TMEM64 family)